MTEPRVSVIMLTHCHEQWVREALAAALAQDWPDLEILVWDDASPDGTWAVVEEVARGYAGPHRLILHRQPKTVGPSNNGRAAMAVATGRWLVFADGDDVSEPGRVRMQVTAGSAAGAGLVSSNAMLIAADGAVRGPLLPPSERRSFELAELAECEWRREMLGATFAFRREIIDDFGPFDLHNGIDHVLPVRAAIRFPGAMLYLGEALVRHRQHPRQLTEAVGDRTQSQLVFRETHAGHDVTAALQCLKDLLASARARPEQRPLAEAADRSLARLLRRLDDWTRLRTRLLNAGQRPTWVARSALSTEAEPVLVPADADQVTE